MPNLTIAENVIEDLRRRRSAGESLAKLAAEIGVSWQRLWTILFGKGSTGGPAQVPASVPALHRPTVQGRPGAGSLAERYRPTSLDCVWGQEPVVKFLRAFASAPYPTALIFEGETGTGKTSAALALADALGCDMTQKPPEFGGVQTIASGEQSAEAVREAYRKMWNTPFYGSGWKVVIVNEADRMARPAETIWLDVLEAIPARTVVIFTTNEADRLSPRFRDRCTRLAFESDADKLRASATAFATAVWKAETGKQPAAARVQQIVRSAEAGGHTSFRRVAQELTVALGLEGDQ